MRAFFLSFLFFTGMVCVCQTDTMRLYQAYSSFSNHEKAEWTNFENNWNFYEYPKLKTQANIKKLNCKNCKSFYADLYLEINEKGCVSKAIYVNGKLCGIPMNESLYKSAFENSVLKSTFQFVRNKKIVVRFGHILKC